MKLRQNVRHFAAKQALTAPVIGDIARDKLVALHVRVFGEKAAAGRREEREPHLEAFFARTFDTYVDALDEGYTEAEAREITHVQANFDFYNHGWTEMMEFPADEIENHYERYADFFERHGIGIDDPLGEYRRQELPEAPSTPERLDDPEHPHAEGGFADDVYVETESGDLVVGGRADPEDADPSMVVDEAAAAERSTDEGVADERADDEEAGEDATGDEKTSDEATGDDHAES